MKNTIEKYARKCDVCGCGMNEGYVLYEIQQEQKVEYLAHALHIAWNWGRGNNDIDFKDMAKSIIRDLEFRY
jgi:hypothetical protein